MADNRENSESRKDPGIGGPTALHGAVFLFGFAGLFGKWIVVNPVLLVWGRVIFAALALGLVLAYKGRGFRVPAGPLRIRLFLSGAVLLVHWLAFFQSVRVSTVAVTLISCSTAPVFAALLEPLWFREPFSLRALAAALVTVAGMALMVAGWAPGASVMGGVAYGVAAGGSFAVISLLNRSLRQRLDTLTLTFYQCLTVGALALPLLPIAWMAIPPADIARVAFLGVVGTAMAHGLFSHALKTISARQATLVANLEPIYGILLAAMLLGEIPNLGTVAGGALILLAAGWVSLRPQGG